MSQKRFIQYLQYEKRFSQHTVKSYRTDINQFSEYVSSAYKMNNPALAGHSIIRSWIVSLMEKGLSPNSVNRKITALKTFFRFLLREGVIKANPMKKITAPKSAKKLPQFVEQGNMNILLDQIDFGEGFEAVRNRLIIEMFYSTGMRLSELINLKETGVNLSGSALKILGKRNKERIIPFGNQLHNRISQYLEIKRSKGLGARYLFVTSKNKKLYEKLIYRLVNNYLGKVTTISKQSPHVLRHTFATHMLNNGADLNAIKELLGHANLSATEIYTHNTFEKLKNIYKQAHPRA